MSMSNSDEPVWRSELPDLTNDLAAALALDAERDRKLATVLEHSLARLRRQAADDSSDFQSAIDESADFGSAIG
jgi:hypothetical protein